MKLLLKSVAMGLLVITAAGGALAQDGKSSQADAVGLIKKAQEYIKANGLEKAYVEFNSLESPFNTKGDINKHSDLYLYTIDYTGLQVVHGKNPKIRGKVMIDMRDSEGVYLIKGLVDKCKGPEGKGWVDYKWPNPVSKNLEPKSGYIERIPGTEVCLGTGIYK
jgi:signal transduction histidine kinase